MGAPTGKTKFNPDPRMIVVQPIHDYSIYYYMAVMDIPNEMCNANPFYILNEGDSPDTLTAPLMDKIVFTDFSKYPDGFSDFTTYLMPLYTNTVECPDGPPFTSIIVTDSKGVQKSGHLAQSKPVIKFEEPIMSEEELNLLQPFDTFRPFVILNESYASNSPFFVGGLMRSNSSSGWGLQFDRSVSPPDPSQIWVLPQYGLAPNGVDYYNSFAAYPSGYNQYTAIGNNALYGDPTKMGYFIDPKDGTSLYDTPAGTI